MPFIPLATDDAEAAAKKLRKLKAAVDQETQAMADTYSKDQGYKPSPLLNKPKSGGASGSWGDAPAQRPAPPAGAIAFLKANPGRRAEFEAKYGAGSATAALGQ